MAKKQANSAAVVVPIAEPVNDISPIEQTVNAFEYAAWHFGSAFARWRRDCLIAMPANTLTGATGQATFSEISFAFRVTPAIVVTAMIFAAWMGFLGGLLPAMRAARMPITSALRAV